MQNKIELHGSYIVVNNDKFELANDKYILKLSFSENFGFCLDSFCNLQGIRPVEYIKTSQPFSPIKPQEIETEEKKTDVFDNSAKAQNNNQAQYTDAIDKWSFLGAVANEIMHGGVKALELTATAYKSDCKVTLHLLSFPKTSVVRYWFDIENTTEEEKSYFILHCNLSLNIDDPADTYNAYWFRGAHGGYEFGKRFSQGMRNSAQKINIGGGMCWDWVPMIIYERENGPRDGVMFEMDCICPWNLQSEFSNYSLLLKMVFQNCHDLKVNSGDTISTPVMTIATYAKDMDNLMVELYDWQYEYMWDYKNNDYFAKYRDNVPAYPWIYCSRVLNEQYGYRLICMDLFGDEMRAKAGIDIGWDDAGWSSFPGWPDDDYMSVFQNTYEGPDHRLSTRALTKSGMKRLLWFAKQPSLGILGTKEGAWGEFEWRTDGIGGFPDLHSHWRFVNRVKNYLGGGLKRSFHTCHGGGTYALNFDIQRYANYNYASDSGCGPYRTYYYSYFTVPDSFGDSLPHHGGQFTAKDGSQCWAIDEPRDKLAYHPDHARSGLALCGLTGPNTEKNYTLIREDTELYDYFKQKGVAGRYSYLFHPGVYGDKEFYYPQRTSRDRLHACIIIRRRPEGRVVIYPKGLLENAEYTVSFEISDATFTKSGAELMEEGIVLKNVAPRELIFFNMTDSPSKRRSAPSDITNAVAKKECNVGVTGIGVYWSSDQNTSRYYEIARNGEIIGTTAKSKYYFDRNADLKENPQYSVRAIGYGDAVSPWTDATLLSDSMPVYSTLGSHSEDMYKSNWSAETSTDLKNFTPMKWVNAKYAGADLGGTPNQEGGIEGLYEGGQCAKIGRGWAQASPDCYCVRTFTVPQDGNVTLTGRAVKEWYHNAYGSDVQIFVMHNEETLVPITTLKCGDVEGISYNQTLDVKKGDVLRFIVGKCDADKNCNTHYEKDANIIGWNTIIAYNGDKAAHTDFSVRINCGGDNYTDQSGRVWAKDCYCTSGNAYTTEKDIDTLYKTAKTGDVEYKVPVPNGVYAVRLMFAETELQYANERFMTVNVNGSTLETAMDIIHDVRGKDKPFSKVYRYIVPNENGEIDITLGNNALINGIEIVPENDDVIHVNCGGEDFVDWAGFVWNKDRYFDGGEAIAEKCEDFRQAAPTLYDRALYLTGRKGDDITYQIPVKEGIYSVQLKFTELELENENERPMDIYINNIKVKENFDALAYSMEKPMSADIRFDDVSSVNGKITVRIVAKGNNPAIIRAIEIDS